MTKPTSIIVGSSALALAIGAGIAESVLAITHFAVTDGLGPADDIQIAVRVVVYAAGLALAVLLYRGHRWARWTLLIMIGLLWLGTLVIPMAGEALAGNDFRSIFGADVNPVFPLVRSLHLVLVPIGLIAMFRRSASEYLAGQRGRTALVG